MISSFPKSVVSSALSLSTFFSPFLHAPLITTRVCSFQFYPPTPHTYAKHDIKRVCSALATAKATMDDDPFADDIDWDAFDPDAAVAAARGRPQPPTPAPAQPSANKRAKTSPANPYASKVAAPSGPSTTVNPYATSNSVNVNPYASSGPAAATNNPYGNTSQQQQQPFGQDSRFAIGTKADASDYPTFDTSSVAQPPPPQPPRLSYGDNSHNVAKSAPAMQQQQRAYKTSSSTSTQYYQTQPQLEESLRGTLEQHFGHSSFRPGQLDAITALIGYHDIAIGGDMPPRDVAVFWATGSGKSMVYQIPPLHTGKIAIVVSPLISLMEDQVGKLNGLLGSDSGTIGNSNNDVAVFLGSGQMDPMAEERALNGHYKLIYLTPEKLQSGNFLDRLGRLHNSGSGNNICLIAVDESHCCSEWGHDFRPEYRLIGQSVRSHLALQSIPMLALTATAVPRVQTDILQTLRMRDDAKVVKKSFDRANLQINVKRKPVSGGSYRAALKPLVDELVASSSSAVTSGRGSGQSTIVYCPTRDSVEEVAQYLSRELQRVGSSIVAEPYHAGLTPESRTRAHTNFLVGRTAVIVATVAFGMGIDKADTRRVIHWGAPKTVEEYYQQIGRAGRDGLPAIATMYANDADFTRYKSDFYLGNLSAETRRVTERSIDALRTFAMDEEICRRAAILHFFDETPKFGERCGTCDTCRNQAQHGDDLERDFAFNGARAILRAANGLDEPSIGTIEAVLKGNVVEQWRYRYSVNAQSLNKDVAADKDAMPKKKPIPFFKELIPALVSRGYLDRGSKSAKVAGGRFSNSWTTYNITTKGRTALHSANDAIVLPVPESVREVERAEEEKRQKTLAELQEKGYDLAQIPKDEVENGDGEVIRALQQWHNYIDGLQRREKFDRVNQLDDLRNRIEAWRSDAAEKYRMAPSAVMPEHLVIKIAYTTAGLPATARVDKSTLLSVGVRSRGVDDLVTTLREWSDENSVIGEGMDSDSQASAAPMILPEEPYSPPAPWEFAVYKPQKKTGLATWESSYNRFMAGESPTAIAMNPANGRPIQATTVVKHIQDGLVQGRPVPLKRLADFITAPNKAEWEELCRCEDITGLDVTKDPKTSGVDGGSFRLTDFLVPVMGNEFIAKDFKERTEEERSKFNHYCNLLNWYLAFRRAGFIPRFEGDDSKVAAK